VHLSREIAGGHVPRDELVGHADDVAEVGRQLEAEHRKLEAKSFGCRKGNIFSVYVRRAHAKKTNAGTCSAVARTFALEIEIICI
jgi:hypothetical protein